MRRPNWDAAMARTSRPARPRPQVQHGPAPDLSVFDVPEGRTASFTEGTARPVLGKPARGLQPTRRAAGWGRGSDPRQQALQRLSKPGPRPRADTVDTQAPAWLQMQAMVNNIAAGRPKK